MQHTSKMLLWVSCIFVLAGTINASWNTITVPELWDGTYDMSTCYQGGNPNRTNAIYATSTFDNAPPIPDFINTLVISNRPTVMMVDDKDNAYSGTMNQIFAYKSDMTVKWSTSVGNEIAAMSLVTDLEAIYVIFYDICSSNPEVGALKIRTYSTKNGEIGLWGLYETPDTGSYENCGCCHGSVTDSNANTYFSTTEWVVKFDSQGEALWETQFTPLYPLDTLGFKRQFLLSQDETTVFMQSKGSYDGVGNFPCQTIAFSSSTGRILWGTGYIANGYSMLAAVMGGNNDLVYISLTTVYAISSADGVTILWSYTLPSGTNNLIDDVGQVLISGSYVYIVQESRYLLALQIANNIPTLLWQYTISTGSYFGPSVLVNDNILYSVQGFSSTYNLIQFDLSTGIENWSVGPLDLSPDCLIASSYGSVYIGGVQGYYVGVYQFRGDSFLTASIFGILTALFWVFCFILCIIMIIICLIPCNWRGRELAKMYVTSSGPIDAILVVREGKRVNRCVCILCLAPTIIPVKPFDVILVLIYGLVLQLMVATILVSLTNPVCGGSEILETNVNCNRPAWISVLISGILTACIVVPLRACAGGCTSSICANQSKRLAVIAYMGYTFMFVCTLGIIYLQREIVVSIFFSWIVSIMLDWVTGPFIGLLCCYCKCIEDCKNDNSYESY